MLRGLSRLRQIFTAPAAADRAEDDLARLYRREPAAQHPSMPLETDVSYAVDLARYYPQRLRELGLALAGAHILELGPGKNFGLALILASYGARVTVADRFLCPWDDNYHPRFYAALKGHWEGPKGELTEAVAGRRHASITTLDTESGGLSTLAPGSVDAIISHAVFEHLVDVEGICRQLGRITRPGGIHIHQIDYRDHRDQSRPLEHLLIPEAEFTAKLASLYWNTGNRWRHNEFCSLFEALGFDVLDTLIDPETEHPLAPYLPSFIPRLRASQSRYRDWPEEQLGPLGARLSLRKRT